MFDGRCVIPMFALLIPTLALHLRWLRDRDRTGLVLPPRYHPYSWCDRRAAFRSRCVTTCETIAAAVPLAERPGSHGDQGHDAPAGSEAGGSFELFSARGNRMATAALAAKKKSPS